MSILVKILSIALIFVAVYISANLTHIGYYSYYQQKRQTVGDIQLGCCFEDRISILNPLLWLPFIIAGNISQYTLANPEDYYKSTLLSLTWPISIKSNHPIPMYFDVYYFTESVLGKNHEFYYSKAIGGIAGTHGVLVVFTQIAYWILIANVIFYLLTNYPGKSKT
jgi:hypothetical protein